MLKFNPLLRPGREWRYCFFLPTLKFIVKLLYCKLCLTWWKIGICYAYEDNNGGYWRNHSKNQKDHTSAESVGSY